MMKTKKGGNPFYIENNQAFRQSFLVGLNKLGDTSTLKTGVEEIRELITNQVQDSERVGLVLSLISENNDHQKSTSRKETLKIIGIMAEIFEDRIIEFLPKILALVTKKLKESDIQLHAPISDSLGSVIGFGLRNFDLDQAYKHINSALKTMYNLMQSGSKNTQIGAAMSIAKIIQSSPVECLYYQIDEITYKLIDLLKLPSCKAQLQIFECILSLILAVEDNVEKLTSNAKQLLPIVISKMANQDWNVRKIAVEVTYTLSVLIPDVLSPYKPDILKVLNQCRFDKIKNVRDIAITAINIIKDIADPYQSEQPERDSDARPSSHQDRSPQRPSTTDSHHHRQNFEGHRTSEYRREQGATQSKWNTKGGSPKRQPLEKNPNFFNKAVKGHGEVEIFTKSPQREKPDDQLPEYDPTIQVYTPLTGNHPYNPSDPQPQDTEVVEPDFHYHEKERSSRKRGAHDDRNTHEITPQKNSHSDKNSHRDQQYPNSIQKENLRNPHHQSPKQSPANPNHQQSPRDDEMGEISSRKGEHAQEFKSIFKQLKSINKQQSKVMEGITTFQASTQNEISLLKNRNTYLEEYIEKIHKDMQHMQQQLSSLQSQVQQQQSVQPPPQQPPYYNPGYPPYQPPYGQGPQFNNYYGPGGPTTGQYNPYGNNNRQQQPLYQDPNRQSYQNTYDPRQQPATTTTSQFQKGSTFGANDPKYPNYPPTISQADKPGNAIHSRENSQQSLDNYYIKNYNDLNNDQPKSQFSNTYQPINDQYRLHFMERLRELLSKNQLRDAYEICLTEGDEESLLSLMKQTGVVIDHLHASITENLLNKLKSRIFDEINRPYLMDWIDGVIVSQIEISRSILIALHDLLAQLINSTKLSSRENERVKTTIGQIIKILDADVSQTMSQSQTDFDKTPTNVVNTLTNPLTPENPASFGNESKDQSAGGGAYNEYDSRMNPEMNDQTNEIGSQGSSHLQNQIPSSNKIEDNHHHHHHPMEPNESSLGPDNQISYIQQNPDQQTMSNFTYDPSNFEPHHSYEGKNSGSDDKPEE